MPALWRRLGIGIVKVDRDHVVRLSVGVSLREEEYSPGNDEEHMHMGMSILELRSMKRRHRPTIYVLHS